MVRYLRRKSKERAIRRRKWYVPTDMRRMVVRTLFCDVKSLRTVRIVIAASEKLAQDRIISAMQSEYIRKNRRRGRGTHGFLTPLGLMCQPAR